MAKTCGNCKSLIGFLSPDYYELDDDIILCYDCGLFIKEDMKKLYYAENKNEFDKIKKRILTVCKKEFTEYIYKIVCKNINAIECENGFSDQIDEEDLEEYNDEVIFEDEPELDDGVVFSVDGVRGRHLNVYDDKVIITTKVNLGSFLTGNVTDAEKTIYYVDCIGVQFKQAGALIGYLQLETSASQMNNRNNNFFTENSFTFDTTSVSNKKMLEVSNYIKKRIEFFKSNKNTVSQSFSVADEIKKFKELLDLGIITQEEFDVKKKQLLNL